jgi:hypothetical protein
MAVIGPLSPSNVANKIGDAAMNAARCRTVCLCLLLSLSACANQPVFIRCPVNDLETARSIAVAAITEQGGELHQLQTGYGLDLKDMGRFWQAHDGPNMVENENGDMAIQIGGVSFGFRIAKCSGAISDFRMTA